jgi:glycosyltransferase involved in cell wall biosynthesis
LIHVYSVADFLVFAALYPKWTGAKVILDIQDVVPESFKGKAGMLKVSERLSAGLSDHVIISNRLWKQRLFERSIPNDKYSVLVNHIDPPVSNQRNHTRKDGKLILLLPNSFQAHQDLAFAIRAFARLKDRLPHCEVHLYGGGGRDSQRALENLAGGMDLNGRVRICSVEPLDQTSSVIVDADIAVVPAVADGFGNEAYNTTIMDFMSHGVAVIAPRGAVDTCCFSDETVCFFKSGDDQAMAEALLKVIMDPSLRDRLSRNGLECATLNNWSSKKAEYLTLVDSLCAEKFQVADPAECGLEARV